MNNDLGQSNGDRIEKPYDPDVTKGRGVTVAPVKPVQPTPPQPQPPKEKDGGK